MSSTERGFYGFDHLQHALLVLGREILGHVGLAHRLSEVCVGIDRSSGASAVESAARRRGCVRTKSKRSLDERLAQEGRHEAQRREAKIGTPVINRVGSNQLLHAAKEVGRKHQVLRRRGRMHRGEVAAPIERRRERLHLLQRHFVVLVLGIAAGNDVHGGVGKSGFDGEHRLRVSGRLRWRFSTQFEQAGDVLQILVANLLRLFVIVEDKTRAPACPSPTGPGRPASSWRRRNRAEAYSAEQHSLILRVDKVEVGGPDHLVDGSHEFRQLRFVFQLGDAVELGCSGAIPALLMVASSMQEA